MKMFRIAAAALLALSVIGCVLTPGKFDAAFTLRKDGSFSYRYSGQIALLTNQAMMAGMIDEEAGSFNPESQICWKGDEYDLGAKQRKCKPEEIEQRRQEWESGRAAREESRRRESAQMKAMLGGIDPDDPATMEEFARRLQGYQGWKRVVYKGEGLFEVEYELSGRLDHDFVFPVFPDVDYIIPFVEAARVAGGKVRIVAPAFVADGEGRASSSPLGRMFQGAGAPGDAPRLVRAEGRFTLTTDAEILTNNSHDGPSFSGGTKVLTWVVGPLDNQEPEALLQL